MSFIRAGSNPEALYVYDDVNGFISFTQGAVLANPSACQIKPRDFYNLVRKYLRTGDESLRSGDFEIETAHVYDGSTLKKIKLVPENRSTLQVLNDARRSSYKILVRNKGVVIGLLWKVTWNYMAQNVGTTLDWRKKKRAKSKHRY